MEKSINLNNKDKLISDAFQKISFELLEEFSDVIKWKILQKCQKKLDNLWKNEFYEKNNTYSTKITKVIDPKNPMNDFIYASMKLKTANGSVVRCVMDMKINQNTCLYIFNDKLWWDKVDGRDDMKDTKKAYVLSDWKIWIIWAKESKETMLLCYEYFNKILE